MTLQELKTDLKFIADQAKKKYPNDKPMIRQIINDETDFLCKENRSSNAERLKLEAYACKLHPKY
jgi:hypothetical protein